MLADLRDIYSSKEMKSIQLSLVDKLNEKSIIISDIKSIAGFDIQTCRNGISHGVICIFDINSKEIIEIKSDSSSELMAYESGFLAFRELPLFLKIWDKLEIIPDIVVFDGYGQIHPRKLGLASHASFYINKPTFGIAKKPFVGNYKTVELFKGIWEYIVLDGEKVGVSLCTIDGVKPIYLSLGNHISLNTCIDLSMMFTCYRIPELTRQPDIIARKICRQLYS